MGERRKDAIFLVAMITDVMTYKPRVAKAMGIKDAPRSPHPEITIKKIKSY